MRSDRPVSSPPSRFATFRAIFVPVARLAYLATGTWMIFALGRWSPRLTIPLLACFLPTILHLTLALPRSRAFTERHPYLLRWVYGLPALGLLAYIALSAVAPVMGGTSGNNLGFLLARWFQALTLESRNAIAFGGFSTAALLLGFSAWSWKTRGWRAAFLLRPTSTIATLLVAPLGAAVAIVQACSLLSLPEPVLNAGAFVVHATLYTQFIAARSTTLVLFPIAACFVLFKHSTTRRPARVSS